MKNVNTPISLEWTPEDMKIFWYILAGIAFLVLMFFIIMPMVQRSFARKQVLQTTGEIASLFSQVETLIREHNLKTKEETRNNIDRLSGEFSSINRLISTNSGINWLDLRERILNLMFQISCIYWSMRNEIAFGEKARREGPGLLKSIPNMIRYVEEELAISRPSLRADLCLKEARSLYLWVQAQQSGMTIIDWDTYRILLDIRSKIVEARLACRNANDLGLDSRVLHYDGDNVGFGAGLW